MLSGIAVTGGAGALTGRGTAALFTDEETFTDNSVRASASTAGVIELDVSVDSLDKADGLIYTIDVRDLTNNNPSYIWVQPATCPEPVSAAGDVDVELRLERDGGDGVVIRNGTLESVVSDLRKNAGVSLSYSNDADARCFDPGESVDLVLKVIKSDTKENFSFELEFYAEQCRYNTGTSTPFEELNPCGSGQSTTLEEGKGISFIAFCSESDVALNPDIVDMMNPDDDGAPRSLEWETDSGVRYVTVKSGQNFTIYDYSGGSTMTDTVTTGGNDDALYTSEPSNSQSSAPCELAANEFETDPQAIETSVKLEFNGDQFVPEKSGGGGTVTSESNTGANSSGNNGNNGSNGNNGNNGRGNNSNIDFDSTEVTHSR